MGMFDYLKVEEEVPIPQPKDFDLTDVEFQTKSLDNAMFLYIIANDKCLYKQEYFEKNSKKIKIEFHGIINFSAYKSADLVDNLAEYSAKFTDGILQEIKLIREQVFFHDSKEDKHRKFLEQIKKEKNKTSYRILNFIQTFFLKYPFQFLGFKAISIGMFKSPNCTISLYFPEILLGFKKKQKTFAYGFALNKIDTEISLKKTPITKEFFLKILGVGLSIIHIKPIDFDKDS